MYKKSPCETIKVQREFTLQNGGPVDDKWSYARYKHLCIKYTLYCKSSKNQVNYFKIVKNHVKSRDSQVHLDRGQVVFPGTPRAGNFHDLPTGSGPLVLTQEMGAPGVQAHQAHQVLQVAPGAPHTHYPVSVW